MNLKRIVTVAFIVVVVNIEVIAGLAWMVAGFESPVDPIFHGIARFAIAGLIWGATAMFIALWVDKVRNGDDQITPASREKSP